MSEFLKKIICFLAIGMLLFIIADRLTNYIINKHADVFLSKNWNVLILGHSHSECAYNDSLIDNVKNLSESGESYFYTYAKLSRLLKNNKGISTVFIEFTNNQINVRMNDWIWGGKFMTNKFLPKYYSFLEFNDKLLLLKNNPSEYFYAVSLAFKKNWEVIAKKDFNYINKFGGYRYLVRNKTDSLQPGKFHQLEKITDIKNYKVSEYNLLYLSKCIELCKSNKVKVVLMRSPLHELYTELSNENVFQHYRLKMFNDVTFMDFKSMRFPATAYGDVEHLNYKGAVMYSRFFDTLLKKGVMDSANYQQIIDMEIAAWNAKVY